MTDLFTSTLDAAASYERAHTDPDDDRPTLADAYDDRPPVALPDPYVCIDPWCPVAGRHLHGTRPDGARV